MKPNKILFWITSFEEKEMIEREIRDVSYVLASSYLDFMQKAADDALLVVSPFLFSENSDVRLLGAALQRLSDRTFYAMTRCDTEYPSAVQDAFCQAVPNLKETPYTVGELVQELANQIRLL
jgi:hypothetical protein